MFIILAYVFKPKLSGLRKIAVSFHESQNFLWRIEKTLQFGLDQNLKTNYINDKVSTLLNNIKNNLFF